MKIFVSNRRKCRSVPRLRYRSLPKANAVLHEPEIIVSDRYLAAAADGQEQLQPCDEVLPQLNGVGRGSAAAPDCVPDACGLIIAALVDEGLLLHLEGDLGGAKLTRDATRVINNTARFLQWSYSDVNKVNITQNNVMKWFQNVISHQYSVLSRYASHCSKVLSYKPSTVRNHVGDIVCACEWVVIYGSEAGVFTGEVLLKIRHVAAAVRKLQVRRERELRSRVSMDSKVRERRMPTGGLEQLQRAVDRRLLWALSLKNEYIDEEEYKQVLGLLYSALYVYSAQGRISGVIDLSYEQAQELLTAGYVTTDQFKTNDRWGLQPVTLSLCALQLLQLYLEYLRPRAVDRSGHGSVDALWLCFNGDPDKLVGQRVTAFFKRHLQLHITTTAIRSLVETTMDAMHVQGRITNEQRASIHAINGHSGATTKDYYIQKVRGNDVQHAREAFQAMFGAAQDAAAAAEHVVAEAADVEEVPSDASAWSPMPLPINAQSSRTPPMPMSPPPALPVTWQQRPAVVAIDFGTAHPDYQNTSVKARWTDEEKDYIGQWCARKLNENPLTFNVVAKCRKHILNDPDAWPIFHANHVLDSGRLRNGYRTWVNAQ